MKKALIGNGGAARELKMLMNEPNIVCYVDDEYFFGEKNTLPLSKFNPLLYEVLIAIGDSKVRERIVNSLPIQTKYFTFIHNSVLIYGSDVEIGLGSFIYPNVVLSTNIKIGNHSHINTGSTISHDARIGNFFTTSPGVNIAGNLTCGNNVFIGINSSTREKVKICDDVIIGLNSGVVKDITESGIYIGTPAKKIK